ncbi:hypothetical protein O3G_MSEX012470 [Manduca sexta]|uniref:Uncharacterized protein n=1 Tax=Manduca sexta TaxID=7130 RepID=A0A922CVL2_MANSE|nr:hypothetical protein O3G_MSEX012470 [Manduca sexta]
MCTFQVCKLEYPPKTANQALTCLAQVARRSALGARDAERFIEQLLISKNSKTQLALLIGTICEYHPDQVENNIETILRTFLSSNVLYGDRNSVSSLIIILYHNATKIISEVDKNI